jgi:hypothetical protein
MIDVNFRQMKLKLYNGIDEMPMQRYMMFQKYALIDSGVGSSLQDFDTHITTALGYIQLDDKQKAAQELQNLRQNIVFIIDKISPKHYSFIALIHSINGKEIGYLSDDSLMEIHQRLLKASAKEEEVDDRINDFKKKIYGELGTFYPQLFDIGGEIEAIVAVKKKISADIDFILGDDDAKGRAEEIELDMLRKRKVLAFGGKDSSEVELERRYENDCIILSQHTNKDVKLLTVREHYAMIDYARKQNKRK